jgi:hypothetical protein
MRVKGREKERKRESVCVFVCERSKMTIASKITLPFNRKNRKRETAAMNACLPVATRIGTMLDLNFAKDDDRSCCGIWR